MNTLQQREAHIIESKYFSQEHPGGGGYLKETEDAAQQEFSATRMHFGPILYSVS